MMWAWNIKKRLVTSALVSLLSISSRVPHLSVLLLHLGELDVVGLDQEPGPVPLQLEEQRVAQLLAVERSALWKNRFECFGA